MALSLVAEGYTVYANSEASGALTKRIADEANDRMRAAGVHVMSTFAVLCDLMRDWRNTPGSAELLPYYDTYAYCLPLHYFKTDYRTRYLATYGYLARGHAAAVDRGTILPGESE